MTLELTAFLERKMKHSIEAYGPHPRGKGIAKHIRKELVELEESEYTDLKEWVDVILLALDGAWRTGATPEQVSQAVLNKQAENEARFWPDWRTKSTDEAICHVKAVQKEEPVSKDTAHELEMLALSRTGISWQEASDLAQGLAAEWRGTHGHMWQGTAPASMWIWSVRVMLLLDKLTFMGIGDPLPTSVNGAKTGQNPPKPAN